MIATYRPGIAPDAHRAWCATRGHNVSTVTTGAAATIHAYCRLPSPIVGCRSNTNPSLGLVHIIIIACDPVGPAVK